MYVCSGRSHFLNLCVAMTLRAAVVLGVVVAAAAFVAVLGQDSEHTCLADGSHCSCRDEHESCQYWQSLGEW